ncbi:WD domain, G-beta repeat protein [Necator americanus]|uniref:WD domain, G-beta repeat protein n=1 Tax=Necator americanus TaxID=51031 RepID=W2TUG8_NECAM|nr:WD domain, G-beta repeat protein [Necator americanus]ETN84731.1 WD domain, G-beta repeat protein [Necator americanus]
MIGHDSPITAISPTTNLVNSTRFISASCDGHLCLWDVQDGRCIDSVSTLFIHRHMQPYTYKSSRHTRSTRLFCIGDYSDIVVMDPQDLTVVFQLSSRFVETYIYDLATPLYEDESKRLDLRDVKSVSFNPLNDRILLVVCSNNWQDPGEVTCSLYVSSQGKLILGRADGLIVMTYACETLARQLLDVSLEKPTIRRLIGHKASVSNLFYPFEHHPRFDPQVLLSGADDFAVIAWNINTAVRLYRFSVHGGPILRFLVPPANTSKQISKCMCSVAADHSVSLLNIRDMKCVLLASRHPHPVSLVKWRPLDDFMLVKLDDGSVYVWQMETASMDRVVTGVVAEEVLAACDEQIGREEGTDEAAASHAVVLMRTLRYRGMDMMKGRGGITDPSNQQNEISPPSLPNEMGAIQLGPPMSIQSLPGCNQGAHLIQFEIGSLIGGIVNLDSNEEAAATERRTPSIITRAESGEEEPNTELSRRLLWQFESNLYLDIARLLLSLLHAWNLDKDLDAVCAKKLALNKPKQQLYFGNVSRHGQLSVVLPQRTQRSFDTFSTDMRWQASHSLTTTHLLAVISTANTLMGMRNAAAQIENTRRSSLAAAHPPVRKLTKEGLICERQQLKQGARLQSSIPALPPSAPPIPPRQKSSPPPLAPVPEPSTGEDGESGVQQVRRNQATAIILLGVVGAEFGDELNRADLTRATALSLLELLVAAPSPLLPVHSPLRRAAIDLLGRGFSLQAHHGPVTAVAFSEDGKYLATYGGQDAKINFWQTSQTFLGMGQSQMKLAKTQPAPAAELVVASPNGSVPGFRPKLVWINPKALTLMLPEGREQRFTI